MALVIIYSVGASQAVLIYKGRLAGGCHILWQRSLLSGIWLRVSNDEASVQPYYICANPLGFKEVHLGFKNTE